MNKFSSLGIKNSILLALLLFFAFLIRLFPLDFPKLTQEEARIAFRGYALSTSGKDELGRQYPLLFNSLTDYQLPAVSYITASGEILFGKSDFGARIPFILLGVALVWLIYKIAQIFSPRKEFWLLATTITAFSPSLIFLSKIPNESILLTFILTFLFYLLIKRNPNPKLIFILIALLILSSKFAWSITAPFVIFTLIFFPNNLLKKTKVNISLVCILISLLALIIFWQVPQGKRSLLENNFSIFNDVTIKNGIDQLRGQNLESNWPPFLEKVLLNKTHFLTVSFLNWLSQLQPSVFFGQFDETGVNGFINSGALQKILIIPFAMGLVYIIKKSDRKHKLLLIYPFVLTFPLLFTLSSTYNLELILSTLPFISLIIALGLLNTNRLMKIFIVCLMFVEIGTNFLNLDMDIRGANNFRPSWVREVILDGLNVSANQKLAFSDNLTQDLAPFIQWYMEGRNNWDYENITFPYKFRQSKISNIKIIGSDNTFYKCGFDIPTYVIASERDVKEIKRWLNVKTEEIIIKVFKDNLGHEVAYFFEPTICVQ